MNKSAKYRRYISTCKQLKHYLLSEIPKMDWMKIQYREELSAVVKEIIIQHGAKAQLFEIVCIIFELMIDNDVDDLHVISFNQDLLLINNMSGGSIFNEN